MRKFEEKIDGFYSMDDTPDIYLDDEQIQSALKKIKIPNEEAELAAVELLKKSEQIHRDSLMGKISDEECTKQIQALEDEFVSKYGFWPSASSVYENFYSQFVK